MAASTKHVVTFVSACSFAWLACGGEFRFDAGAGTNLIAGDSGLAETAVPAEGCRAGAGCGLASLRCSSKNECVECLSNADCMSPGLTYCLADTGRCASCSKSSDCKTGFLCDTSSRTCIEKCGAEGSLCKTPSTKCDDTLCRACEVNANCKTGQFCNRTGGTCSECLTAADCKGEKPICAPSYGACVGCLTAKDCTIENSVCDPATNTCVIP
jgi:hypothetical protein